MKNLVIVAAITCAGCVGFHAEISKEKQAEYNLNLACTNLSNSVKALEKAPQIPDLKNLEPDNSNNPVAASEYKIISDPTPAHIFTNGLSLYLLMGSELTSNAVYFYDAPRGISDTNEAEVWFRFTNSGKVYTEYFPNWKVYAPNDFQPAITYKDCDSRVNTNFVNAVAHNNGTNFIGVFMDMVAVRHPEDGWRYAGVAMMSACTGYEGEYLKDISEKDFQAIFVDKTKPEYSK